MKKLGEACEFLLYMAVLCAVLFVVMKCDWVLPTG